MAKLIEFDGAACPRSGCDVQNLERVERRRGDRGYAVDLTLPNLPAGLFAKGITEDPKVLIPHWRWHCRVCGEVWFSLPYLPAKPELVAETDPPAAELPVADACCEPQSASDAPCEPKHASHARGESAPAIVEAIASNGAPRLDEMTGGACPTCLARSKTVTLHPFFWRVGDLMRDVSEATINACLARNLINENRRVKVNHVQWSCPVCRSIWRARPNEVVPRAGGLTMDPQVEAAIKCWWHLERTQGRVTIKLQISGPIEDGEITESEDRDQKRAQAVTEAIRQLAPADGCEFVRRMLGDVIVQAAISGMGFSGWAHLPSGADAPELASAQFRRICRQISAVLDQQADAERRRVEAMEARANAA